ncbi:MAG: sigma-70 family RNA polymerase sigma factor [Clostridia bacterium]|nr:sigma-70 family RNA polymerase sigma factor [Clostridia bacterium]
MSDNEALLLERIKKGDITSFELLIADYQVYAYNIAYRMLGNEEDAKDITQEALIKVYKSINKFKGTSSFSTWLYRIVMNTCKDELKKRKEVMISLDKEIETGEGTMAMEIGDERLNPSKIVEKNEITHMVQDAISRLPEDNRMVVVLRDIQGLSYEEISEVIKEPIGTVKSRINRGRNMLKKILTEQKHWILSEPY